MKRINLISQILQKSPQLKESTLRVRLTRIKNKYVLKSTDQAACFYIKINKLPIRLSSIMDDVTRQAIRDTQGIAAPSRVTKPSTKVKTRKSSVPNLSWIPQDYYPKADQLSDSYGYFYIFENALRVKITAIMSSKYPNWWDTKIKIDLPDVDRYYEKEKAKQDKNPMVGDPDSLQPIDYITLGQLELIITKYQNDFIPSVFRRLDIFTGHMDLIKSVRNGLAHMAPSIMAKDIRNAKNEINILLQYLSTYNII